LVTFVPMPQPSFLLTTLNAKYIHMNLAIRLLYELNKADERLTWKEFTIKENPDEIASHCSGFDVVCFSCYIWNITQTLAVAEKIKQLNPATKILLGGPEVTYDWQAVIQLDYIDFIVTGEGEIPFAAFLQQYPQVGSINNIVSKQHNELIYQQQGINFPLEQYANTNTLPK